MILLNFFTLPLKKAVQLYLLVRAPLFFFFKKKKGLQYGLFRGEFGSRNIVSMYRVPSKHLKM